MISLAPGTRVFLACRPIVDGAMTVLPAQLALLIEAMTGDAQ